MFKVDILSDKVLGFGTLKRMASNGEPTVQSQLFTLSCWFDSFDEEELMRKVLQDYRRACSEEQYLNLTFCKFYNDRDGLGIGLDIHRMENR